MDDNDRDLLHDLKLLGQALGPFALGIMEHRVSSDEQVAFGIRLVNIAERLLDWATQTPITIQSPAHADASVTLPTSTIESHHPWPDPDWRP